MEHEHTRNWSERIAGQDCPFDRPDSEFPRNLPPILRLSISTLCLERNQTYRGFCVLVFNARHVARMDQLTPEEWADLARDLYRVESAVYRLFSPDHVNVASLGNVVPHLHWHIIPRYAGDSRWGDPIWTTDLNDMERTILPDEEFSAIADALRRELQR